MHAWIAVHCDYEINVGFLTVLCQSRWYALRKVSNTPSEQAEITRKIPLKITLNLPKSLFTQKLLVIQHSACCRMFYSDCLKSLPFATTQELLTALSVTCWSKHSYFSMICCRNLSTVWIFPAVNSLLKNILYFIIDWVEVWTIWRPKWWWDEVWCLTLEQIDHLLCTMSTEQVPHPVGVIICKEYSICNILKQPINSIRV